MLTSEQCKCVNPLHLNCTHLKWAALWGCIWKKMLWVSCIVMTILRNGNTMDDEKWLNGAFGSRTEIAFISNNTGKIHIVNRNTLVLICQIRKRRRMMIHNDDVQHGCSKRIMCPWSWSMYQQSWITALTTLGYYGLVFLCTHTV